MSSLDPKRDSTSQMGCSTVEEEGSRCKEAPLLGDHHQFLRVRCNYEEVKKEVLAVWQRLAESVEVVNLSEAEPFEEEDQAELQQPPEVREYWPAAVDDVDEIDVTVTQRLQQ